MRILLSILFSLILFSLPSTAQNIGEYDLDPVVLAEAYVKGKVSPHKDALAGEAAENPIALSKLPQAPNVESRLHWKDSTRALVALEFSNARSAQDLYTFMVKIDGRWRIEAFREFDLPSVFYMQLNHYRNKGENALRQDWEARWKASNSRGVTREQHETVHGTVDERVFYVFNLRLTSSSDRDMVRHFEFLKAEFEELKDLVLELPKSPLPFEHNSEIGKQLLYILVKRVHHPEVGPIRFEVASIENKDVGYLYCKDKDCLPIPTPSGVIALMDLGDGWWLYRTI